MYKLVPSSSHDPRALQVLDVVFILAKARLAELPY